MPWTVVSLDGSVEREPYTDGSTQLVANDEMADIGGYYWRAPQELLGLRVNGYGQLMHFHTSWVVRRGDTAGKPIMGPDVILEVRELRCDVILEARGGGLIRHSLASRRSALVPSRERSRT